MQQLSLFEDIEEAEEDVIPEGCTLVPEVGETIEYNASWLNGDTSPEALASLASDFIGDTHIIKALNGDLIFFKNIASRIEGDHVVLTGRRFKAPWMFNNHRHRQEEDE